MKYSLSQYKKRTRRETGERDCVFTCVYLCVKWGQWGPSSPIAQEYWQNPWIEYLASLNKGSSSSIFLSLSSFSPFTTSPWFSFSLCLRWYESLRSSDLHLSLVLHLSFPHFPFVPSTQIKKLMRDRFFTNCPRNVYHWWNYNVGPAVLFISQLGEVLLDLMGSRHTEYI